MAYQNILETLYIHYEMMSEPQAEISSQDSVPKIFDATPIDNTAMLRSSMELTKLEDLDPQNMLENGKIRREFDDPKSQSLSDHAETLVDSLLTAYDYNYSHVRDYLQNQYERYKARNEDGNLSNDQLLMFRRLMQSAHGKLAYQAVSSFEIAAEKKLSAEEASKKAAEIRRSYVNTEEYLTIAGELRKEYESRIREKADTSRNRLLDKVRKIKESSSVSAVKEKLTFANMSKKAVALGRYAILLSPVVGLTMVHTSNVEAAEISRLLDSPTGAIQSLSSEELAQLQQTVKPTPTPAPEASSSPSDAEEDNDEVVPTVEPIQPTPEAPDENEQPNNDETSDSPDNIDTDETPDEEDKTNEEEKTDHEDGTKEETRDEEDTSNQEDVANEDADAQLRKIAEENPDLNEVIQKAVAAKEGREGISLHMIDDLYALTKGVTSEEVLGTIKAIQANFGDLGNTTVNDFAALSFYESSMQHDSSNGKYVGILQVDPNHLVNLPQFSGQYGHMSFQERHEALKDPMLNAAVARVLYDRHANAGLNPFSQWHPAWVPNLSQVLSRPYTAGDNEKILNAGNNA